MLEALEGDLAGLREPHGGRLAVAACGAGERFVARELARFSDRHPDVEVTLTIGNHAQLAERIAGGSDDLALVTTLPPGVPVVRQWVAANPFVVMAAHDDPFARERDIPFAQMAERASALREPGSATRALTERLFAAHGLRPRARFTLSSHHAVREAVRAGDGLAVLPRDAWCAESDADGLVALDVQGFPVAAEWHLVYRVGAHVSPAAQAFLDHMRGAAAAPVAIARTAAPRPAARAAA